MAKLLQLALLAAAATVGYGSGLTAKRTGVSFTLNEETLGAFSPKQAAARYPDRHRMKATGAAVLDGLIVEAARGLLHLTEENTRDAEQQRSDSFGAAFFELAAGDARMKEAVETLFSPPAKTLMEKAKNLVRGPWRHSKIRSHAKNVADFASGASTDVAQYEASRAKIMRLLKRLRKTTGAAAADPIPFEFLPQWRADLKPGAPAVTISGGVCYPSYTAEAAWASNGTHVEVTLTAQGSASSLLCAEQILLIAGGQKYHFELYSAGTPTKSVSLDVAALKAESATNWFLSNNGVRAFVLPTSDILSSITSILDTLTVLEGFSTLTPSQAVLDANLYFINNYIIGNGKVPSMGPIAVPRPANNSVVANFDPSNIQSGDLLMLLRRDGIDPMIGWGEGSIGGHSVVAVRTGPNDLQICESTTKDGYWPDNGVQCHDWDKWVELCIAAGQNVVLVPLSAETRKTFDTNKALSFLNTVKGVDYGYSSFLFGWIDTATQNFPCTPGSNYKTCLDVQFAEQIAILMDGIFGSEHINFFRQALAHRTGQWTASPVTTPTTMETLAYASTNLKKSFSDLIQIIERDEWQYQTAYNAAPDTIVVGKSMVCCVFVCNMWKAGGVFDSLGGNFTCAEQTLWDLFSMKIYDEDRMNNNRPEVCKTADPTNPLCQLMGDITMHLAPNVNTRPLYKNMGERCAAETPLYIRPEGC